MNKGFTLIELLVVVTIISLLSGAAFLTYTQIGKSSRDARRKADLEQIRMALEMYRSNNDVYPDIFSDTNPHGVDTACGSVNGLTDSDGTYLSDIPNDPRCPDYKYYYAPIADASSNNTDYILGAYLEGATTTCNSGNYSCGGESCNYCLGPFGAK